MSPTLDLLCESLSRLSGSTQIRVLGDALPWMTEEEQIILAPVIAAALQPHLLLALRAALDARIQEEGIEA